jgi:Protein of unknown function (DUF3431)
MLVIVSRYNEDVSWTKLFKNVVIYNKGEPLEGDYNQIMLENVGREGHTYYKHIVDNYEKLDDFTVFLQGNPFDHSPNLFEELSLLTSSIDFYFLSNLIFLTNTNRQKSYYEQCERIEDTFEKVFNVKADNNKLLFGSGAQFVVSRELILNRPKEFYENIVNLLKDDINPREGHHIERFHYHIFTKLADNRVDPFNIDNQILLRIFIDYMDRGKKCLTFL